jgi:hypothetical protein
MFSELKRHPVIWVVGPQRSGTRIASKMIAHDTGHELVDEVQFYIDSSSHLSKLLQDKADRPIVVQGPAITRWIHHLARDRDSVVFMFRPLDQIHASEKRISWKYDGVEAMKYGEASGSAELKIRFWNSYQRGQIKHAITFPYGQLSQHPLWIPKGDRGDFRWNQTTIN